MRAKQFWKHTVEVQREWEGTREVITLVEGKGHTGYKKVSP